MLMLQQQKWHPVDNSVWITIWVIFAYQCP